MAVGHKAPEVGRANTWPGGNGDRDGVRLSHVVHTLDVWFWADERMGLRGCTAFLLFTLCEARPKISQLNDAAQPDI